MWYARAARGAVTTGQMSIEKPCSGTLVNVFDTELNELTPMCEVSDATQLVAHRTDGIAATNQFTGHGVGSRLERRP